MGEIMSQKGTNVEAEERSVAVGGDVGQAVIVTGDGNRIEVGGERDAMPGDRDSVARALRMARRSLATLEEQAAGYTSLTLPAHLKIQLEDKRREVAELKRQLED
jgi:hypothetical protein